MRLRNPVVGLDCLTIEADEVTELETGKPSTSVPGDSSQRQVSNWRSWERGVDRPTQRAEMR